MSQKFGNDLEALLRIEYGAPIEFNLDELRPKTRAECVGGIRPCPWAGCRHHLYLDVNGDNGSIKINHPRLELEELAETCSLDVAERGGVVLEQVGQILNVTRERARQIEFKANRAFHIAARQRGFDVEMPGAFPHPEGNQHR